MNESVNRIRANVSTSSKGINTWDLTVEVYDPTEDEAVWQERRQVAMSQVDLMVGLLRERFGQGELLGPDMDPILKVAVTRPLEREPASAS